MISYGFIFKKLVFLCDYFSGFSNDYLKINGHGDQDRGVLHEKICPKGAVERDITKKLAVETQTERFTQKIALRRG